MIRNLTFNIFCISYMLGYFQFVPNYILVFIIFSCIFDAFALYFSTQDMKVFNRNPDLKKFINIYLKYTKPASSTADPIWFFLDRFVVGAIFICFIIYYIKIDFVNDKNK